MKSPLSMNFPALGLGIGLTLLLGGCASKPVSQEPGSGIYWVSEPRTVPVRAIVIHHTASDAASSLKILSGLEANRRVSCHYLITDEPDVETLPLVPDDRVAYHAGESYWLGVSGLNASTLGIEIVNLDGNLHAYSEAQVKALAGLLKELIERHNLRATDILAHSDISPGRKIDPGSNLPWERLYRQHGLGDWPDDETVAALLPSQPPSARQLAALFRLKGYQVKDTDADTLRTVVAAFQRRYRPNQVDGKADAETVARLRALLAPRR